MSLVAVMSECVCASDPGFISNSFIIAMYRCARLPAFLFSNRNVFVITKDVNLKAQVLVTMKIKKHSDKIITIKTRPTGLMLTCETPICEPYLPIGLYYIII